MPPAQWYNFLMVFPAPHARATVLYCYPAIATSRADNAAQRSNLAPAQPVCGCRVIARLFEQLAFLVNWSVGEVHFGAGKRVDWLTMAASKRSGLELIDAIFCCSLTNE